jgi:hypothetical protein
MRFQDRFELPTAIRARDNEIAMTGTEISSGRPVTIHLLLERQSAETAGLLRDIAGLSSDRRQHILDQGDFEGIPYVITYPLPANISLRAWASTPEPQRSNEVLRPAGYKTPEPGEFTRLFQARSFEPLLQTSGTSSGPSSAPATPASPPAEPAPKPGEFTALLGSFSVQKENFRAPAGQTPQPLTEKPPAPLNEPGEFTRMMRSPLAPEGDAAQARPVMKPAPGEFTRLVQRDPGLDNSGAPGPVAPRQPVQPPSEFTRMLQKEEPRSDDLFSSAVPMTSPVSSAGFATGAFSGQASPVAPANPAPATGPGEFTRIIASPAPSLPAAAPVASPAAPPPQTTAPKRTTSLTPLIIGLAAIVVIALVLVAVFVLQR